MLSFCSGKLGNVDVVAVHSGCGKINAAVAAQLLISQYGVNCIIFSGIAGGMTKDTLVFDTVVCSAAEFHDTNNEIYSDFPVMEEPVFYADKQLLAIAEKVVEEVDWRVHFGTATTGDIFTKNISEDALCIDMETAAVAHVCYMNQVPFLAIRSISDNKSDQGQDAINRNFDKAAFKSYLFTKEMIKFGVERNLIKLETRDV